MTKKFITDRRLAHRKLFISLLLISFILCSVTTASYIGRSNQYVHTNNVEPFKNDIKEDKIKLAQESVPIGAVGIPYFISLTIGNSSFFRFYLKANKTYIINLYGGFVHSTADYDVFIYDKNLTRLKLLVNDPGEEEFDIFTPQNTSWYYLQVQNNPITSKEISYAILVVLEQLNITANEKNKSISLENLSGGNKTHSVEAHNSSYGYIIDVSNLQEMNLTFVVKPTNRLEIQLAIFQFTSLADKLTYTPSNLEKSESLIKSAKSRFGKEVNVSFIVGRRGTEHSNDTTVILFIKAIRGSGNVTMEINMTKTNIQIDILPYISAVVASIIVFAVLAFSEEKLRR